MIAQLASSQALLKDFSSRGFAIFSSPVLSLESLTALRSELERVLHGKSGGPFDSQIPPTKVRLPVCFRCFFKILLVRRRCLAGLRSNL